MKKLWKGIKGGFSFIKKEFKTIAAIAITASLFVAGIIVRNSLTGKKEEEKKALLEKLKKTKEEIDNKLKQKKEKVKKDEKIIHKYSNDLNHLANGKLPKD